MEDVTARIIVTAEANAAVQGLNNTRKALDDVTQARLRELQVQKAQAQLELAEFESSQAAQKAYAAEIPLRGAERQLESLKEQHQAHIELYRTKKQLGELDGKQNNKWVRSLKKEAAEIDSLKGRVQELTKTYLPLANAEAGANLAAFNAKQKLDALGKSTQNAAKETEKFSWKMAAARVASRAFSMDLGATSNNMIKYGILAAGAASAAKLVKWGFDQMDKAMIEDAELWKRNNENIKETAASWAEARNKQNEALDTIRQYNGQTEISAVDSLKMATAIKTLRGEFGELGFEIDEATGRIKNFDKASAALKRKQIEREQSEIRAQLKNLEEERRRQIENRDRSGYGLDILYNAHKYNYLSPAAYLIRGAEALAPDKMNEFKNYLSGIRTNSQDQKLAGKEIDRIGNEMLKLRKRQAELKRLTPEADAEKEAKAREIDASKMFNRRIQEWQTQVKIQLLRNQGLEREAKLLEINAGLDKERLGIKNDQQRAEFDRNRQQLVELEMAKYDKEHTETYREQMAQRINDMNVALKIQDLRNKGLEREAKLLEINAGLDKERLGIKNEQQRAEFDRNRQQLVELEMKRWDKSQTFTSKALGSFSAADLSQQLAGSMAPAQKTADNTGRAVDVLRQILARIPSATPGATQGMLVQSVMGGAAPQAPKTFSDILNATKKQTDILQKIYYQDQQKTPGIVYGS